MKQKKLFTKYNHKQFGLIRTIDQMDFRPVTNEPGIWFKIEVVGTKPTQYEYVKQSELKTIKKDESINN